MGGLMSYDGFLSEMNLFSGLESRVLAKIEPRFALKDYERGNIVIRKGDESQDVFFVISGQVAVFNYVDESSQVFLREFFPGEMFGELAAIDGDARSAWVVAAEKTQLAVLAGEEFLKTVTGFEKVALNTLKHFSDLVKGSGSRIRNLMLHSPRQRICTEMIRLADVGDKSSGECTIAEMPSHNALAAFASTDAGTVAGVIGDLMREGVITRKMRAIHVKDISTLKRIAQEQAYENMDTESGVQDLFNEIYSEAAEN